VARVWGRLFVSAIDFKTVFDVLPSPYMVLDRDLCFVEVNAQYERVTGRSRAELFGLNMFEAFPDEGESGRLLRESLERVLATGQPDTLALIPYAIPRPDAKGGGFEMRYWTAVHTPLFDETGAVSHIVQNTVDVTNLQRLRDAGRRGRAIAEGEKDLLQRAMEVQEAHRSQVEESARLREMFMQAPGFICLLEGPEHVFTLANHAYLGLTGHRDIVGKPAREALPEVAGQGFFELLDQVYQSGEAFVGAAVKVMLQREPGAPLEQRMLDFVYQPIRNAEGEVSGIFVEGADVTEQARAQERQKLLLDELNHRVKNTLATVQAIAAQTLRTSPSPEAFRTAFEARLRALSNTHDLLTRSVWNGAELHAILRQELTPHGASRFELKGPPVRLDSRQTLTFGLIFHELATNAAKYGALSDTEGCVRVSWRVDGDRLMVDWVESGGPRVAPPTRRGFGSRLIDRSVRGELGGEAEIQYSEHGLTCRILAPFAGEDVLERTAA
jgi:PAS domain S-box-containing protein